MRLLTYDFQGELSLTRDLVDDIPPYAILSHTWGPDEEEVTFGELQSQSAKAKDGYKKIDFCGQQAQKDGLQHFWVDTCCINKANHTELSEAITSMFRWYQDAQVCYVYLSDVSSALNNDHDTPEPCLVDQPWEASFRKSRWFTRGWTLQELLAPEKVVFFSKEGESLGAKDALEPLLHEITAIPLTALRGQPLSQFPVTERMRWTKDRATKKKEDQAYCLLGIFGVYMPLIYGEGDNAFVRLVEEINKTPKVTLAIRVAEGATFDAYGQTHQECHPATRVDLLQSIRDWVQDVNGKPIFWLNGMAGTGKSTISCTIAKWLNGLGSGGPAGLGASFFFKRGEGDRASATLLFPTIARQLAAQISHFDVFLAQAVRDDPQICNKALGEQFNKLICGPLRQIQLDAGPSMYIVVVDALDECDREVDIRTVLQLWSTLSSISGARLRLFLTSRPELVIRLGFKKISAGLHQDIVLHEVPHPIVHHDILAFLTDALAEIREEYNLEPAGEALDDDWPGSHLLLELTDIAVPLFIVAATICRFTGDASRPQEGLETILRSRKSGHLSDLAQVYTVVLRAMTASTKDKTSEEKVYREFRTIVGTIVCLAEPLSRTALAILLHISPPDVQLCLRSLHALLYAPQDGDALIRPLHLSFGEFLMSKEVQDQPFSVDAQATHSELWRRCLQLLSGSKGLREDVCGLEHPGSLSCDVNPNIVGEKLPPAMQYACRYWVYHVQSSAFQLVDNDEIHTFLQKHFIHWLEALSLLGRLADAIDFLNVLKSNIAEEESALVAAFLEDAQRFILSNRFVGEIAPLQLYSSALVFTPQNSIVRRSYGEIPAWIKEYPSSALDWGPELQRLEGHTDDVYSVIFSPDGLLIATASYDCTVRLWNTSTGRELQTLEGHLDWVNSVAFSPDGRLLASASHDQTVRLWNISTGRELRNLGEQPERVHTVAFSPDGTLLASASEDGLVRLWNPSTGQELRELIGHSDHIRSVAFSPDGILLASASNDNTVQLWDISTGEKPQVLRGHSRPVRCVAFSPDGSLLASGSEDETIRLWNPSTGQKLREFTEKPEWVHSVAFSPDGLLLASAFMDNTIQVLNVANDQECKEKQSIQIWSTNAQPGLQELQGHTEAATAVAFSPDSSLLASASADGTARLWRINKDRKYWDPQQGPGLTNLETHLNNHSKLVSASKKNLTSQSDLGTGRGKQMSEENIDPVDALAFSSDGSLLASTHWDVETLARGTFNIRIHIWNARTGEKVQTITTRGYQVDGLAFSSDGSLLAMAAIENEYTSKERTNILLFSLVTVTSQVLQKFKVAERVNELRFSPDNSTLITDVRNFKIKKDLRPGPSLKTLSIDHIEHTLELNGDWLEHNGRNILWLPQGYRAGIPHDRERILCATNSSTLAIGCKNGRLVLFRIEYP